MIEILETDNIDDGREKENENFTECGNHIADESIHVTPAKTETWDETGADLTAHMQDKTNPHGVTCEQIGAAAATDLSSVLDARGSKNLLPVQTKTWTVSGVVFTAYDDGTVNINGTATALITEILYAFTYPFGWIEDGEMYYLSGCPAGGNYTTGYALYLAYTSTNNTFAKDVGSGVAFAAPSEGFSARILVRSGVTVNNLVFNPMICHKDLHDISPNYTPYSPTTTDLKIEIDALDVLTTSAVRSLDASCPINCSSKAIEHIQRSGVHQLKISLTLIADTLAVGTVVLQPGSITNPPVEDRYISSCGRGRGGWAVAPYYPLFFVIKTDGSVVINGGSDNLAGITNIADNITWIQ